MARERSPERDKAKLMWLESGGKMMLKDIAAALSVLVSRVRKWKVMERWEDGTMGTLRNQGERPKVTRTQRAYPQIYGLR